jgi:hypothetical protein
MLVILGNNVKIIWVGVTNNKVELNFDPTSITSAQASKKQQPLTYGAAAQHGPWHPHSRGF